MNSWLRSSSSLVTFAPRRWLATTKKAKKAKRKKYDPFEVKSAFQLFLTDTKPGLLDPVNSKTTQGPHFMSWMRSKPRIQEETVRTRLRERNLIFISKRPKEFAPQCLFYEDRDQFVIYDGRADANNRLHVYPRRIFQYPEDVTTPNFVILQHLALSLGSAADLVSSRQKYRDSSVAYHVKLGPWLKAKDFRVLFGRDDSSQKKNVAARTVLFWLLKKRRMSIDSYRMMANYLKHRQDYYKIGTRFDLLPPYSPVPGPNDKS
mmetsp:Transcript_12161/g.50404  ORF Transcript_12161/g.50404 Transcript_12161/m.50404 type:complete len:262 (+) Transcript_12161:35-820(+)